MNTEKLLSVEEAADYLGLHPNTVWNWVRRGHMTAYKLGPRLVRVQLSDLQAMVTKYDPERETHDEDF